MINKTVIIGAGALGMMYGYHLTRKFGNDSICFAVDAERLERYAHSNFLCNNEPCGFRFVSPETAAFTSDLVIFAVKATQLDQAMDTAAAFIGPNTVILSLLNGITSEKLLEERFGSTNVVYCVAQGMDATRDAASLKYAHMGQIRMGIPSDHPEKAPALRRLLEYFDCAEVPYVIEEDINHRLWSKLMLNVGVNQICMVYEGNYGTIQQEGPARSEMIAAMREVMAVAKCEGILLTEDDLRGYVDLMDTLDPSGMPSMRQDGLAKRKTEVELFAGTIRRLGAKHAIDVPVNCRLYDTVKQMEANY